MKAIKAQNSQPYATTVMKTILYSTKLPISAMVLTLLLFACLFVCLFGVHLILDSKQQCRNTDSQQ